MSKVFWNLKEEVNEIDDERIRSELTNEYTRIADDYFNREIDAYIKELVNKARVKKIKGELEDLLS